MAKISDTELDQLERESQAVGDTRLDVVDVIEADGDGESCESSSSSDEGQTQVQQEVEGTSQAPPRTGEIPYTWQVKR